MSFRPTLESLEERTLLNHGKGIDHSLLTGEIEGEGQALRVHASIKIVIDGQQVAFPQGAGTTTNGELQIHHDDDGGSLEITSTRLSLQDLLSILESEHGEDPPFDAACAPWHFAPMLEGLPPNNAAHMMRLVCDETRARFSVARDPAFFERWVEYRVEGRPDSVVR